MYVWSVDRFGWSWLIDCWEWDKMVRFLALLHSVLAHVVELCTKLLDNESIS